MPCVGVGVGCRIGSGAAGVGEPYTAALCSLPQPDVAGVLRVASPLVGVVRTYAAEVGLQISGQVEVPLDTYCFGCVVDEAESHRQLSRARDAVEAGLPVVGVLARALGGHAE